MKFVRADGKMMEKAALATSLAGIIMLLVLSLQIEPKTKDIGEINTKLLDQWVRVNGTITNIRETNGLLILELESGKDSSMIQAIVYADKLDLDYMESGLKAEVIGKVIEYYGRLEIEVSKIRILQGFKE